MPNNYTFFDSDASILTAESSIISGSVHRPIVTVASFLSTVPTTFSGSPSISGAVTVVGNPSISGTVNIGTIPGSVLAFQASTWPGSILSFQGTDPWRISSVYGNVSGSVLSQQLGTRISSVINDAPSSLLAGASIFGQLPAGTAVLGSVATLQGTPIWNISSVYGNVSGSVLSQQLGTRTTSVLGSIPSSLLTGNYGFRNDAVASFLGGNLSWNQIATDSAGRIIVKPFSSDDGTIIEYIGSVVSTSVTAIRASAIGLRNYVTDFFVANTGSVATLITFQDGSTSVLAKTIAPATGGSNAPGISIPFKSARAQDLAFTAGTAVSVLHMTVRGYQAP